MFNIRISSRLKPKLLKLINSKSGINKFSEIKKLRVKSIRRWLNGDRSFPFKILEEIAKLENKNILDLLDNEIITYERSQYEYKFNKNISLFEVNFIGWFLSEGHLEQANRINISQENKQCLINIKNKLKETFNINSTIERDRNAWKLRINNAAFSSYLQWRYDIKKGKKYNSIRVPKLIFRLNNEYKFSFLAGFLEGDGCFRYGWRTNKRTKYKVPVIFITSASLRGIKDLQELYSGLGLISKINIDRKSSSCPKWSDTYKLYINRFDDCIKLAFNISPYLLHPERKIKLKEIFKDKEILNCIRVDNNKSFIELIKKLDLKRKEIPDYLKKNLNYNTFMSTVNGWINGYYKLPLSIVLHSCGVLGKNYSEVLPKEFAFILDMKSGKERKVKF